MPIEELNTPMEEELRELLEKATPKPWSAFTDDSGSSPHTNIVAVVPRTDCVLSLPGYHKRDPNIQLLCAAVNALPALLSELQSLRAEKELLAELLRVLGNEAADAIDADDLNLIRASTLESALAALSGHGQGEGR